MVWFLPVALGVGVLVTQCVWDYWHDPANHRQRSGVWLLLFLGWVPLMAWILHQVLPQH